MKNMGAILEAGGCSYGDVTKATVLLDEMPNFAAVSGGRCTVRPPSRCALRRCAHPQASKAHRTGIKK